MKKLIQIGSLLTLVFAFTAISASAQSEYGSEVEIPFAFSVNERTYEAGKYIVKLNKYQSGAAAIIISDPKNDTVQTVLARRNADASDEKIKLVFDTINGEKHLSRIVTPGGGFAIRTGRQQKDVAERAFAPKVPAVEAGSMF